MAPNFQHADRMYQRLPEREFAHSYGANVHILSDVVLLSQLARLCSPQTVQPHINDLIRSLYASLLHRVLEQEFPRQVCQTTTRMIETSLRGIWEGEVLSADVRAITVSLLRAGALPSQVCFDALSALLEPSNIRQDHVLISRMVDEQERVTGSRLFDAKIGGAQDNAFVVFPDPMGATGSSMCEVLTHYKSKVSGVARKYIAMHLIVTPEYVHKLQAEHPDVVIYALRLDRGGSSFDVLQTPFGAHWPDECGLNDKQYILPGAGGLGELMNNAFC